MLISNILLTDIYDQNILIIDSGAPSSIMPYKNGKQICKNIPKEKLKIEKVRKNFKFGLSRVFSSKQRIPYH